MTSTNVDFIEQAVSKFNNLNQDDRLSVLELLYHQITDDIPASALSCMPTEGSVDLVTEIQKLSQPDQVVALRKLIHNQSGEAAISTDDYAAMEAECKLAFWYHLAQNLGGSVIAVPKDYLPTEEASEVLDLFEKNSVEEIMSFMLRVI